MATENEIKSMLEAAFESGYSNAADAFSKLTKSAVTFHGVQSGDFAPGADEMKHEKCVRQGVDILIKTEIVGDITGRSYLFLSEKEFGMLTAGIPTGLGDDANFAEEFVKEIDNILSASVISRLSSLLKCKMYGDVPMLAGKTTQKLPDIVDDDFSEYSDKVYVNAGYFSFANMADIHPLFVWVMDCQLLRRLEYQPSFAPS